MLKSVWIERLDEVAEDLGNFLNSDFLNRNFKYGAKLLRKNFEHICSATKLARAVEFAARDLPEGSLIEIRIERHCATVEATDGEGRTAIFDIVESLPDAVGDALAWAKSRELPGSDQGATT